MSKESRAESEVRRQAFTVIRFDETGVDAVLYTASARLQGELASRGFKPVRVDTNAKGVPTGWEYRVPAYDVALKSGVLVRLGVRRRDPGEPLREQPPQLRRSRGEKRVEVSS